MEKSISDNKHLLREQLLGDRLKSTPLADFDKTEYDRGMDSYVPDKEVQQLGEGKQSNWLSDSWNSFMTSVENIGKMREQGRLVKEYMPEMGKLDFQLDHLNKKKQLLDIRDQLSQVDVNDTETMDTLISDRQRIGEEVAAEEDQYLDYRAQADADDSDINQRIAELHGQKLDLQEKIQDTESEIEDYEKSLDSRKNDVSNYHRMKEQEMQDASLLDSDYWKYVMPSTLGSSFSDLQGMAGSTAAAFAANYGKTKALQAASAMSPQTAVVGQAVANAIALGGTIGTIAANVYSRKNESLAQVFGANKERLESMLEEQGVSKQDLITKAKETDPERTKDLSDDQIFDRLVTGQVRVDDTNFAGLKESSMKGLDRVYANNMMLSAIDVAQTAMTVAPMGKVLSKLVTTPIGKVATKLSKPVQNRLNNVVDAAIELNQKINYTKPLAGAGIKAGTAMAKLGLTGVSESFEEGAQNVFDYDYSKGRYDSEAAGVLNSIAGFAGGNARVAAILSGIDRKSELANDQQFWNDVKGGFAMGIFMGAGPSIFTEAVEAKNAFQANSFVRNLVVDQIDAKDQMNKAMLYTRKAATNNQQEVLDVMGYLKNNLPEGITEEDIDAEIKTAQRVMSLSTSSHNRTLAKDLDLKRDSEDYGILVGLQSDAQSELERSDAELTRLTTEYGNTAIQEFNKPIPGVAADKQTAAQAIARANAEADALQTLSDALTSQIEAMKVAPEEAKGNVANVEKLKNYVDLQLTTVRDVAKNQAEQNELDQNSIIGVYSDGETQKLYQNAVITNFENENAANRYKELMGVTKPDGDRKATLSKIKSEISKYKENANISNNTVASKNEQLATERASNNPTLTPEQVQETKPTYAQSNTVEKFEQPTVTPVEKVKPTTTPVVEPVVTGDKLETFGGLSIDDDTAPVVETVEPVKPVTKTHAQRVAESNVTQSTKAKQSKSPVKGNITEQAPVDDSWKTEINDTYQLENDRNAALDQIESKYGKVAKQSIQKKEPVSELPAWDDLSNYTLEINTEKAKEMDVWRVGSNYPTSIEIDFSSGYPEVTLVVEGGRKVNVLVNDSNHDTFNRMIRGGALTVYPKETKQSEVPTTKTEEKEIVVPKKENPAKPTQPTKPLTTADLISGVSYGEVDYHTANPDASKVKPQNNKPTVQPVVEAKKKEILDQKKVAAAAVIETATQNESNDALSEFFSTTTLSMGNYKKDKVSATMFYDFESDKPMFEEEGYKSGRELSTFLSTAGNQNTMSTKYVVRNWMDKTKPVTMDDIHSLGIYMEIEHNGDKYLAALKTPAAARGMLMQQLNNSGITDADEIAARTREIEEMVDKLAKFRHDIVEASIANPGKTIKPVTVTVTNGKFNTQRNEDGTAIYRPVQEVKGLALPQDPYEFNKVNVQFGIGRGYRGDFTIFDENHGTLPGLGGSGKIYIYPKASATPSGTDKTNVELNLKHFGKDRGMGQVIANLIFDNFTDMNADVVSKKQGHIPAKVNDFISKIVNFGDRTLLDADALEGMREALPGLAAQLESKQFAIVTTDGGTKYLQLGPNKYDLRTMDATQKQEVVDYINHNLHWVINGNDLYAGINEAFPFVPKYFAQNPGVNELSLSKDTKITREQSERNMPMTGWYAANGIFESDLADQPFKDPFIYAEGIEVGDEIIPEPNVGKEATEAATEKTAEQAELDAQADAVFNHLFGGLTRPVRAFKESAKMEAKEVQWLKNKLGMSTDEIKVVDNVITMAKSGIQAMGVTRNDAIVLWKGAEKGTAYHEAYHRVNLLLLSDKERSKIYEAYRKKNDAQSLTDLEVEEALAEEFREYMLDKTRSEDYKITKWFKQLLQFVKRWFTFSDTNLDNIFGRIESGYFKNKPVDKKSAARFEALYGDGAPFRYNNYKFKHISNAQFGETVNALTASAFLFNQVSSSADLDKMNLTSIKEGIAPERIKNVKALTDQQKAALGEVYEKFDDIFKKEIINKLKNYNLQVKEKIEAIEQEIEAKASGEEVGDEMSSHIKSSWEVSKRDNALGVVKTFIATIPALTREGDVILPKRNITTGLPLVVDFKTSWNKILNNMHDINTFEDVKLRATELAENDLFFKSLSDKLSKVDSELLQTQILNTLRSSYHNMTTVTVKEEDINGKKGAKFRVNDANLARATRTYPIVWTDQLLNESGMFKVEEGIMKPVNDKIDTIINQSNAIIQRANEIISKGLYNDDIDGKLRAAVVGSLATIGVQVDVQTLNMTINEMYPGISKATQMQKFLGSQFKEIMITTPSAFKTISVDSEFKIGRSKVNLQMVYRRNSFLKNLANTYAKLYPNPEELTVLGADDALLYPISQHNYLSDMIQYLGKDPQYATKMRKVTYNTGTNGRGSYFLNQMSEGKMPKFHTMVAFREQGSKDKGRKYTGISPKEDYLMRMTYIQNDHMPLPTMGDSSTYNTIGGFQMIHDIITVDDNGTVQLGAEFLDQFIDYFFAELDTIEQNYTNEFNIPEDQLVANYHKGGRNGYRFRYFAGRQDGNTFVDYNAAIIEAEAKDKEQGTEVERKYVREVLNKIRGDFEALDQLGRRTVINNYVYPLFKQELQKAANLGIIKYDGKKLRSIKNIGMDAEVFNTYTSVYKNSGKQNERNHAESVAAANMIAEYLCNTIISINEVEKMFIKDPAYYKWQSKNGVITEMSVDKIKRVREILSTGDVPRTQFDPGNPLNDMTEFNTSVFSDNELPSRQIEKVKAFATRSYAVQFLKSEEAFSEQDAIDFVNNAMEGKTDKDASAAIKTALADGYTNVLKMVENKVSDFDGYSSVNQTDATVLISPEMYLQLVRRVDGMTPEVENAFKVLNGEFSSTSMVERALNKLSWKPEEIKEVVSVINGLVSKDTTTDAQYVKEDRAVKQYIKNGKLPTIAKIKIQSIIDNRDQIWKADPDLYAEASVTTLKPLKMMYFGDHFNEELGLNVPVFNKMAMFPVHKAFADGDLKDVLDLMTDKDRPIHMIAFDSAVKVGIKTKTKFYTDDTNTVVNPNLKDIPVYKQEFKYLRRQLITDPHHSDRQMFVSQAQKAALGNLRNERTYKLPSSEIELNGDAIAKENTGATNALSNIGRQRIEKEFGVATRDGLKVVDPIKFREAMRRTAEDSDMNVNVIDALQVAEDGSVEPMSSMSDTSWIESRIISMFNKEMIDVRSPGGMFIQMSSFTYNQISTVAKGQPKRTLRYANDDGSMDAVISLNLLRHILPDKHMPHEAAVKWLTDHKVIGPDAKPIAMGYRIPAQGQSSLACLKIVDVYPSEIGDTITLPDEFTKLTGSDFDVDKLFVARYNFDKKGNIVSFIEPTEGESIEQFKDRMWENEAARHAKRTPEELASIKEEWYADRKNATKWDLNSREANENRLLDTYLAVISNPLNFNETRTPLDTATDTLKDVILADIESSRKKEWVRPLTYLTPKFQIEKKDELNGGKMGIAPFALNNAHHVLTQLTKLSLKPNKVLNKFGIRNLSGIVGEDGVRILDWLSAMINAHVDCAKDPYIIRLNVRQWTFNMTNFLLRSGKGTSTFYFLPQPILVEMAEAMAEFDGFYGVDKKKRQQDVLDAIRDKYAKKAKEFAANSAEKAKVDELLSEDNEVEKPNAGVFHVPFLRKQFEKEETYDWYYNQLLIYSAFDELTPFAKEMSKLVSLSQVDTKKFGNSFSLQMQFMNRVKDFLATDKVFLSPAKFFRDTFLETKIKNGILFSKQILSGSLLNASKWFEDNFTMLLAMTNMVGSKNERVTKNLASGIQAQVKSTFFNKYIEDNNYNVNEMLHGDSTMAIRLEDLKARISQGAYPDLLDSDGMNANILLESLFRRPRLTLDDKTLPDFINFKTVRSGDGSIDNEIIRAWDELLDHDDAEVRKFAQDLVIYSFVTSGDNFGPNTLFKYVPHSYRKTIGYVDYMGNFEKNPDGYPVDYDEIFKHLWHNDDIIPAFEATSTNFMGEVTRATGVWLNPKDHNAIIDGKKRYGYPVVFVNEKPRIVGGNKAGDMIATPYMKIKLDGTNKPGTTLLYKYVGMAGDKGAVYSLVEKKGMNYTGNIVSEYGVPTSLESNKLPLKSTEFSAYLAAARAMAKERPAYNKFLRMMEDFAEVNDIKPNLDYMKTVASKFEDYVNEDTDNIVTNAFDKHVEAKDDGSYVEVQDDIATQPDNAQVVADDAIALEDYEMHSGGAYGADTQIDLKFAEYGGTKMFHYREESNLRLSKRLTAAGRKAIPLNTEQMIQARSIMKQYLGVNLKNTLADNLKARNAFQVINSDAVFAIVPFDAESKEVSGGTKYATNLAAKMGKPVYLLDPRNPDKWYLFTTSGITKMEGAPKLPRRFAGIGTRGIESYTKRDGDQWIQTKVDYSQENLDTIDQKLNELFAQMIKPSMPTDSFADVAKETEPTTAPTVEAPKVEVTKESFTFADGTTIATPFKLNDQQVDALLTLEKFINNPKAFDNEVALVGYAGTGKTTIIGLFDKYLKKFGLDPVYTSPTHRANAVTKANNPKARVLTLHSLFGLSPELKFDDGAYDLKQLETKKTRPAKVQYGDTLFIDESSMVNEGLYEFISDAKGQLNIKVIYMGDPAQLAPVKSEKLSPVFENVDLHKMELTKVERTGDNAVLRESTALRMGKPMSYMSDVQNGIGVEYFDAANQMSFIKKVKEFVLSEEFKNNPLYFRILGATNASVHKANRFVRTVLHGADAPQYVKGELLMGYANVADPRDGLTMLVQNGYDYVVNETEQTTINLPIGKDMVEFKVWRLSVDEAINPTGVRKVFVVADASENPAKIEMWKNEIQASYVAASEAYRRGDKNGYRMLKTKAEKLAQAMFIDRDVTDAEGRVKVAKTIDYGYAHTIHKSQGGTYDVVMIQEQSMAPFHRGKNGARTVQQLKYVGVSRAKKYVGVLTDQPFSEGKTEAVTIVQETNKVKSYIGDITPDADTVFVFGSNPEGRHGAGAAKVAKLKFGAIYGQGEGLQGNAYALPTKDLRVKENRGYRSISTKDITDNITKMYDVARQNPTKKFKVAYRNVGSQKTLSGYSGDELMQMFKNAGEIPSNVYFSSEWVDSGTFDKQTETNFNDKNEYPDSAMNICKQ